MVPKPPEVMQLAGIVEVEVLGGPHLMLAHIGGHDGVLWARSRMVSSTCLGVSVTVSSSILGATSA